MTQMNSTSGGNRPRRNSALLFVALLVAGLAMLAIRVVARPDVSLGEMVLPFLGGLLVAGAVFVIVRRDRQERDSLPPDQRDRQDQGVPR